MANNEWLDEDPEMIKKIPPDVERVTFFWVGRAVVTPFRVGFGIIALMPIFLFGKGRGGPIIELNRYEEIIAEIFILVILALIYFLGRKEKGRVDIYPEMIVFYDYDKYRKEARPIRFYYWEDIVQYHRKEPYIWLESKENLPDRTFMPMRKLLPYFRQYAPHAKEVNFNMDDYWKYRLKEKRPEDKSPEELAIEAEMAANREKAKEVLANAKDVTAAIEDIEAKRQAEEDAARQKMKDYWNRYPEE